VKPQHGQLFIGRCDVSFFFPIDYAAIIGSAEAWDMLNNDPRAQLVDVRSIAE